MKLLIKKSFNTTGKKAAFKGGRKAAKISLQKCIRSSGKLVAIVFKSKPMTEEKEVTQEEYERGKRWGTTDLKKVKLDEEAKRVTKFLFINLHAPRHQNLPFVSGRTITSNM
ncbi:hypothetical protein L2E82_19622 [Cichorium intybus]|uniref:Uncharacterized protein n=1 Tax=Cichorium intybus TaxID=13427 RepID=A0ACB9FBQ1_CICIN|nr:hypothetical protein L2E82_19622 [Cichorium intybus]